MKAYYAVGYGGPEVMRLGDLPDPVPGRGEVLVRVKAVSVNPVDWKVRRGDARLLSGWRFPRALGTDFAGEVVRGGPGVEGFPPGRRVYGAVLSILGRPGTDAELTVARASHLRPLPQELSFELGAALPVAGLTALDGLRQCGDLTGRSVAVNGGTGGVGHLAIQIAKARGARVTSTCRAANVGQARELGADEVLVYYTGELLRPPRVFDAIFDTTGRLSPALAFRVLAPRGTFVTTLPGPWKVALSLGRRLLGGRQIRFANMRDRMEDYADLEELVLSGRVRPVVDHIYSLDLAAQAYEAQEAGGIVGKVVISVP